MQSESTPVIAENLEDIISEHLRFAFFVTYRLIYLALDRRLFLWWGFHLSRFAHGQPPLSGLPWYPDAHNTSCM
jgi:hypothetical protein